MIRYNTLNIFFFHQDFYYDPVLKLSTFIFETELIIYIYETFLINSLKNRNDYYISVTIFFTLMLYIHTYFVIIYFQVHTYVIDWYSRIHSFWFIDCFYACHCNISKHHSYQLSEYDYLIWFGNNFVQRNIFIFCKCF